MKLASLSIVAICTVSTAAHAEDGSKAEYYLLEPTPAAAMRGLATGETPYTVDAGHLQLEVQALHVARDRSGGERMSHLSVAPLTIKLGVLNFADLQISLCPFEHEEVLGESSASVHQGFGDLGLAMNFNLLGNDEEGLALSLTPYLKLPTDLSGMGNGMVEGGLTVPLAYALPFELAGASVGRLQVVRGDSDYGFAISGMTGVGHEIIGGLGAGVELEAAQGLSPGDALEAKLNAKLELLLADHYQLATAVSFGLTESAEDLGLSLGVTARL